MRHFETDSTPPKIVKQWAYRQLKISLCDILLVVFFDLYCSRFCWFSYNGVFLQVTSLFIYLLGANQKEHRLTDVVKGDGDQGNE